MVILTATNGNIEPKDQLKDYKFRGEELADMNFLGFMLDTYKSSTKQNEKGEDNEPFFNDTDDAQQTTGCGRPLSTRIPYQDDTGKGKHCRIIWLHGYETLPRFVGKWFNRNDNEYKKDLYKASMLMLLHPWRNLHELKKVMETFEEAYNRFILQADQKTLRVIANIQYFYECLDGGKAEWEKPREDHQLNHAGLDNNDITDLDMEIDDAREIEKIQGAIILEEITDDDIDKNSPWGATENRVRASNRP